MAFFDKLNDLAKNIGDKTNDAIETTKLNSKINGEKSAAAEAQTEIERIKAENEAETVASVGINCPSCGAIVASGIKFCPECGQRMEG